MKARELARTFHLLKIPSNSHRTTPLTGVLNHAATEIKVFRSCPCPVTAAFTQQLKVSLTLPLLENSHHCTAKDTSEDADVVAAYLWYDGYIALPDQTAFVPIHEVLYTQGRPEREAVRGGTSDCISDGGIPILSDRLFRFVHSLSDGGTEGQIIYRGHNQAAYDTVQRGFHRFGCGAKAD